jgi:phage terminase large subunit-like protein
VSDQALLEKPKAARKRAPRKPAIVDQATDYAQRVMTGELIAGPHVRNACARHLRDLREAPARGFTWSVEHAQDAIAFFAEVLCLNGGDYEGRPFILQPWQAFVVGSVAMYQQSPELLRRLTPSGSGENVWNLGYRATGSWFRPISADDGQSGPRPHVALIDEVHEHKTAQVVEMMRAGTKSRRQALIFMITNSGAGQNSPCGIYHAYASEVAAGNRQDDSFFGYVCGLDEGDDPLRDESCWPKANPSLQLANLPGLQYLREQVTEALGMPAKEAIVRRLNFCQWTAAINPWLSAHVWEPCADDFTAEQLRGRRAFAGLDLSSTTDLTAFVLLVEPETSGGPWSILPWCWLPEEGLADRCQRDRVDYQTWKRQGHLETTPGRAISKRAVLQRVAQICAQFDVQGIAADRWRLEDFRQQAADDGIELPPMLPFGQGFKDMSPALDAFETAILNRTVRHNGHPVLTWCAANAVTDSDPAGNRKLNKIKATGRIDLVVAAVMAYASAAVQPEDGLDSYLAFIAGANA